MAIFNKPEIEQFILSDVLERSGYPKIEPDSQMWNALIDQLASDYDMEIPEFKKRIIKAELAWYKAMGMKWSNE